MDKISRQVNAGAHFQQAGARTKLFIGRGEDFAVLELTQQERIEHDAALDGFETEHALKLLRAREGNPVSLEVDDTPAPRSGTRPTITYEQAREGLKAIGKLEQVLKARCAS